MYYHLDDPSSTGGRRTGVIVGLLAFGAVATGCAESTASPDTLPATSRDANPSSSETPTTTVPSTTVRPTPPPTTAADATDQTPTITTEATELVDVVVNSGVVPIVPIANGEPPPLPTGAVERRVDVDGHEVFVVDIPGDGPPIVLLHGFPDNLHLYDRVHPLLDGHRVVAFDFIGWGRSDKPAPTTEYTYSTAAQVNELRTVIDALELQDVTLVVHDQSAPVGLEFLRADPTLIGRLVLLNGFYAPSPFLSPPKGIELHALPALQPVELAVQADAAATESFYRFQMDEFIVTGDDEMIDPLWASFGEARPAFIALCDVLIDEVVARLGTVDELREITVPVDIVYGAQDPYLTVGTAEEFHRLLPNSTLTIIDDAGHFVQIDAPDAVAAAIRRST